MDKKEILKNLIDHAVLQAKQTNNRIYEENVELSTVFAYASFCQSKVSVAESFYYCNIDELLSEQIEKVFAQFANLFHVIIYTFTEKTGRLSIDNCTDELESLKYLISLIDWN